jgi:hypothetical protein
MFEIYIINFLIVFSILVLWFFSPLKITLGKFFFKANYNIPEEFDDKLFLTNYFLGTLSGCWICVSFWLSLISGIVVMIVLDLFLLYPLLTFLMFPGLLYILYRIIKK